MKKISLFCLLIFAFASCKKTSVSKMVTPPDTVKKTKPDTVVTTTDTLLVSAVIGSHNISRFQYDANKRLVSETDSGTFDAGNITVSSSFSYDSQGNLIKREVSSKNCDTVYNITYVNGLPTSASYIASFPGTTYPNITGTIKYTVTNNKVTEIDGSVYPSNLKVQITYSGNNIASISVNGTFANPLVNYTYGTKNSPYAASRFKWFLFPDCLPLTEWIFYRQEYPVNMFNKNDVESFSTSGAPQFSVTFTNQYDASGYPTQIISSKTIYDPSASVTYQYLQ
jgi:YD repeat-containing protein